MIYQPRTIWIGGRHPCEPKHTPEKLMRIAAAQAREDILAFVQAHPGCEYGELLRHLPQHTSRMVTRRIVDLCTANKIRREKNAIRIGKGVNGIVYVMNYYPVISHTKNQSQRPVLSGLIEDRNSI